MPRHQIETWNVAHRFTKRKLLIAINCLAALSIFFFGYDQGMMSGVNNANDYIYLMGFGHVDDTNTPVITDSLKQGGIVAVYYLGTLVGAFAGGMIGDRVGRVRTIALGAAWGILGASLQCSAQNHVWMIFARLVNGFGTGILNAIVPVWATETAAHTSRGQFVAIEFSLNIFGVVVAYWLEFGLSYISHGTSPIRWRLPIAFQILPLLLLLLSAPYFPESPRWLVKVGRDTEARWLLGRLRGDETDDDKARAEKEFQEIQTVAELERGAVEDGAGSYWGMFWGRGEKRLCVGRRVQLVIWLQIMQEWTGIAGVTVYAPTIFRIAGFDRNKSDWLSGLNNIMYMFATLIGVFTIDRLGRRKTLYWGSILQSITMVLAGLFAHLSLTTPSHAQTYGSTSAAQIFIFTSTFGATWLTVPWLYPAEIFPLAIRAKGNAWGVVGWSIGNGWLTLLCPVMFDRIGEKTLYLFGVANAVFLPVVWAFYPESNQRTLEEMDALFEGGWWAGGAERRFRAREVESGDLDDGGGGGGGGGGGREGEGGGKDRDLGAGVVEVVHGVSE